MSDQLPDLESRAAALLGSLAGEIDIDSSNRIFCNRNMRLETVELIGFDMDYTLAQYNQPRLEELSTSLTLDKLIEVRGYPKEIRGLEYDPAYAIRGLVVDRQRGNVFKMDRHCHVGRVYHGFRRLTKEERHKLYRSKRVALHLPRYHWIDTLYGLPEAVMYITLVDYFDKQSQGPSYSQLFGDIRSSIDEAHRDDTLKSVITSNPQDYVNRDDRLAETLHKLRSSGKKLFLLTNSLYDYTAAVMAYLLDDMRAAYLSWRSYFDVAVVGGSKPGFFNERKPFVEIDAKSGEQLDREVRSLVRGRIYQGGNIFDFERMTGVKGEGVLYVGDHIYGDILRLKKSHVWRTAMVIQELEGENTVGERLSARIADLAALDRRRRNLDSEIDYRVSLLKSLQKMGDEAAAAGAEPVRAKISDARRAAKESLERLRSRMRVIAEEVDALEESIDRAYNPHWGAVFREGNENSRFGEQVSDYADLYTTRASNFLYYSPLRYFRAPRQRMPHE